MKVLMNCGIRYILSPPFPWHCFMDQCLDVRNWLRTKLNNLKYNLIASLLQNLKYNLTDKVVCTILYDYNAISVANLQNPFSVHLVKLRKRALKFLAHFSLVCLGKCPKAHEKWSQMEKLIWGYIFHPSGMLWRPFGGRFLRVLHPKGVFRSLFLRISCFYKSSKPLSGANAPGRGFDDLWLYSKCTGKGFWQWEGVLNVSKSSRGW